MLLASQQCGIVKEEDSVMSATIDDNKEGKRHPVVWQWLHTAELQGGMSL